MEGIKCKEIPSIPTVSRNSKECEESITVPRKRCLLAKFVVRTKCQPSTWKV